MVVGLCLLAYLAPGQSQPGNDATANVHLALRLIEHGTLFFTPEANPKMFFFASGPPQAQKTVRIHDWQQSSQGLTARDAYAQGIIRLTDPIYYIVPTRYPGKFANTFGIGAGLLALPIVAPVRLLVGDLASRPDLLWWLAKLAAALSVAGAVAFLYVAALRFLSLPSAALVALAYGLATCAFSISSQALWQHGPCELFLAMGAYFLLATRGERRRDGESGAGATEPERVSAGAANGRESGRPASLAGKPFAGLYVSDLLCGLGFALAVFCRPTIALVVVSVGVYFLVADRRRLVGFVVGGLPVAVVLIAYSQYTFGSPFSFGQLGVGTAVAQVKTGQPGLWQTPLWLGMAGLLLSPARGLFVHTPLALFAVWGTARAFRDPAWKDLRPLAVAVLLLLGLASKWFDWWGGWCFGYRPIVDLVILLAFLSFPVVKAVATRRAGKAAFAALFAYSFGVQVLGAFAYDVMGWNNRVGFAVVEPGTAEQVTFDTKAGAERFLRERGGKGETRLLNIDLPEHRHRLWSVWDSPLVYYLGNFSAAREARAKATAEFLHDEG
jgi:hypothetical protein